MVQTKEQNNASCRKYHHKNKDKLNKKCIKYYVENREDLLRKSAERRSKNPSKYKKDPKRSERYYGEGSRIRIRAIDAYRYNKLGTCEICNSNEELTMHHILYEPTGVFIHGKELEHRGTLCRPCHNSVEGKHTWITKKDGVIR